MKQLLLLVIGIAFDCLCTRPAVAMDIGDGIRTGESVLLQQSAPSDNEEAVRIIRASFERLLVARGEGRAVGLRVTDASVPSEALLGSVVVVNDSMADLPEDERLFQIAHELGHIDLAHLDRQIAIYRQYVGASVDDTAIARTLNAHAYEFSPALQGLELEADAYAQDLLGHIPGAEDGGIHTFLRNSFLRADYSHPSSRERLQHLLALQPAPPHIALR